MHPNCRTANDRIKAPVSQASNKGVLVRKPQGHLDKSGTQMAQVYYSAGKMASPLPTKESAFDGLSGPEGLSKVEDVQEAYIDHKDR